MEPELVTEGNLIYAVYYVGNNLVKTFHGYVVQPTEPPEAPDRISQLESDNAFLALQLADTQARLDVSEQAQADLILSLVEKGVL
jgi:hypothetical protein